LDTQCCPLENTEYREINGSWRLLTSEATERLSKFIESYEAVRINEGRGSSDPQFYRSRPYRTGLDRRWLRHWKQRADSYEKLLRQVIEPCEAPLRHLTVLDLGAGNGWLSNRLAERGHTVIAVDLQTNDFDGLGCRK
jgi:2-polyprenyl-3-methyl-5-hydroxy-6-metoxy-1,4-benzoquinol methylase